MHNAVRVARGDHEARERVAEHKALSVSDIVYNDKTGAIHKAKMIHGKDRKNFGVNTAQEFIASIALTILLTVE